MVLVKILKRKDASSLVVGVSLGIIIQTFVMSISMPLVNNLVSAGPDSYQGIGWKDQYLVPVLALVIELLLLEVLARLYIWADASLGSNKK